MTLLWCITCLLCIYEYVSRATSGVTNKQKITERSWVRCSITRSWATCKPTVCWGELSLLPSVGREMRSRLPWVTFLVHGVKAWSWCSLLGGSVSALRGVYSDTTRLNWTHLNSTRQREQLTQFVGRDVINKNTTDLAVRCSTGSVELSSVQFSWVVSL